MNEAYIWNILAYKSMAFCRFTNRHLSELPDDLYDILSEGFFKKMEAIAAIFALVTTSAGFRDAWQNSLFKYVFVYAGFYAGKVNN